MSVVISTYDRPHLLDRALRSALAQRGVDHEVVVVDNGSTDPRVGDVLERSDHPRLRTVRNEISLGGTAGRNSGLAVARGEWLAILDDDDLWAPTKLQRQLTAARQAKAAWSYTGCVYIDDQGRIIGGRPPLAPQQLMRELPYRFVVPGGMSNLCWRADALDDRRLDPHLFFTVDWDLALRLHRVSAPAAVIAPLVAYRQHRSNASRHARRWQRELDVLERKHADLRDGRPIDRSRQARFLASEALRAGHRREAAGAALEAVRGGDVASALRLAAVTLPRGLHPWARRAFLSDREWLADASPWVVALERSG